MPSPAPLPSPEPPATGWLFLLGRRSRERLELVVIYPTKATLAGGAS